MSVFSPVKFRVKFRYTISANSDDTFTYDAEQILNTPPSRRGNIEFLNCYHKKELYFMLAFMNPDVKKCIFTFTDLNNKIVSRMSISRVSFDQNYDNFVQEKIIEEIYNLLAKELLFFKVSNGNCSKLIGKYHQNLNSKL